MPTVSFTGVKSCTASDDAIDVVFKTRYSGDLAVKMTRTCLGELVAALSQDAGLVAGPAAASAPTSTPPATPVETSAVSNRDTKSASADGDTRAQVPKKWAVGAETQAHNVVLLFFDPQTERQGTFALTPKAANQMAHAMIEKAKVVKDHLAARKTPGKSTRT
jgi:hypothetical protein